MNDKTQPYYLAPNSGFGVTRPEDELLHPEVNKAIADDSLTETQFFGFSVPQASIHAIGYTWHHPNLHVVSGGLLVFKGIKVHQVAAEISDVRMFVNDRVLTESPADYRLPNGYGVKVLEPLKRLRMTYSDPARKNSVDIEFEAAQPPAMYADGCHFEQTMRAKGEVMLRGERFDVDCYHVRDRSWGKPRDEGILPIAPVSWISGVFNDDFAFRCDIVDQVDSNPELKGCFELPLEKTVKGGWIRRDGKLGHVVRARKKVVRDFKTLLADRIELELTDDLDRTIHVKGRLYAACPWQVWPNFLFLVGAARWECEGMVTYGDFQEGMWADYAVRMMTVNRPAIDD